MVCDDACVAREAQLVYSNVEGWNPVGNSLRTWRGEIKVGFTPTSFVFEIFLPNLFPSVPPVVRGVTPMVHPNIDNDQFVHMRILENWRAEFHVYQVINSLVGLFSRAPPTRKDGVAPLQPLQVVSQATNAPAIIPSSQTTPDQIKSTVMQREVESLKNKLREKDEELVKMRHTKTTVISDESKKDESTEVSGFSDDLLIQLESDKIAISELLAKLHDDYAAGEVNIYDYSRLYKKYSRDLYIVAAKINFVKQEQAK